MAEEQQSPIDKLKSIIKGVVNETLDEREAKKPAQDKPRTGTDQEQGSSTDEAPKKSDWLSSLFSG